MSGDLEAATELQLQLEELQRQVLFSHAEKQVQAAKTTPAQPIVTRLWGPDPTWGWDLETPSGSPLSTRSGLDDDIQDIANGVPLVLTPPLSPVGNADRSIHAGIGLVQSV
jgi:hypothetical protein